MRLYPNWEQLQSLKNPLTEGERALVTYLDNNLPQDTSWTKDKKLEEYNGWLIFVQPFLNGTRPDIIIFNPFIGVVIYEVKDWNLSNYKWKRDEEGVSALFVHDSRGSYPIKSPIKQVEYYKDKIIGQLVPNIGELIDKDKRNFGLIKTAVYFHKARTSNAQELFDGQVKNFKYFPVFGYDSLTKERLKEIVPDINIPQSYFWKKEWNEELMFWFYPPYHSIEQGIPLKLKYNQVKVAEPSVGHHRVRGIAGSGKTQALAYRAGSLAAQGYNVLIVSFNITLWHYIKDMIARAPFNFSWGKFTFTHFHGFCKDRLNQFGERWPKSPQKDNYSSETEFEAAMEYFFRITIPEKVTDIIRGKEYDHYDAILIDEGQDYHYEWYKLFNEHFLTTRDELLVVCDKKQNIYERELDWVDKRITRQGLEKFKNPYIDLTSSFRMPARVAEMSNRFSEIFNLNQELKISKIEQNPVLIYSQHIIWQNFQENDWLDMIDFSFQRLKKEGYNPSDMVILLPNRRYGNMCVEHFKLKNIEVNHVFEDDDEKAFHPHKKAFWMGDSRLKMSTIHSFKGWELLNIILFIPYVTPESNEKLDKIIYTAITRTRENLIVLNCNRRYFEFGEKYPKKWHEQEI